MYRIGGMLIEAEEVRFCYESRLGAGTYHFRKINLKVLCSRGDNLAGTVMSWPRKVPVVFHNVIVLGLLSNNSTHFSDRSNDLTAYITQYWKTKKVGTPLEE